MSRSRTVHVMFRLQYCQRVFPSCHSHGLPLRLHPRANEVATATVATCWPLGIRQLKLNICLAVDPQVITSFLSSVGQSVRLLTSRSGVRASQGAFAHVAVAQGACHDSAVVLPGGPSLFSCPPFVASSLRAGKRSHHCFGGNMLAFGYQATKDEYLHSY